MNGRPGGQRLSEGGPSHPCPPAPGLGLGVGWHSIPARALGGLWLPPSLLRLQGQARVYPGIPGPEVRPSSEGQGLGWLLPGWGQWAGATAEVSYAAEERGWITTRSGGDWEAVDGRPRPRSCSVCPGPGGGGGPSLGLGYISQGRLLCSVSLEFPRTPGVRTAFPSFPQEGAQVQRGTQTRQAHAAAPCPPPLPPGRSHAGLEKPPRGGLPQGWLSPRLRGEPTLVPALRAVTRQPGDSGQGPPSLCRLQQARHPHPTRRPGTGVLSSGPPQPWAQPAHNKHLIHKEAKGTSRNRNVASAEEAWTPRGCPANPSGHHLGDGAHTFLGQGALSPTVASPQGPRISEAWGQG